MSPQVSLGKFGNIKKMMKVLSKRDLHIDLEFICGAQQQVLYCHRFIVCAQSRFLKTVIEEIKVEDDKSKLYLPDIQPQHMEIVLQFLYTGKMKLGFASVEPVRELLVKILRIDADFKLPCDPSLLKPSGNDQAGPGNDDRPGPSGSGRTNNGSQNHSGNPNGEPPTKRFRSNSNQSQQRPNCNGPQNACPMSPPHELSHDFSDDEDVRVITPPPKSPPPVYDLSDNENTSESPPILEPNSAVDEPQSQRFEDANVTDCVSETPVEAPVDHFSLESLNSDLIEEEPDPFGSLHLTAAPKIITKRTAPHVPPKQYFAKKSTTQVPPAPGFIAKRTGKRKERKSSTKRNPGKEHVQIVEPVDEIFNGSVSKTIVQTQHNQAEETEVGAPVQEDNELSFELRFELNSEKEVTATRKSTRSRKKTTYAECLSEDDLDKIDGLTFNEAPPTLQRQVDISRQVKNTMEPVMQMDKNNPIGNVRNDDSEAQKKKVEQEEVVIPVPEGDPFTFKIHGDKEDVELKNINAARATRTSTRSRKRKSYVDCLSDEDCDDDSKDPSFDRVPTPSDPDEDEDPSFLDLPPPVPQAPEPGTMLYRGDWMKIEKVKRLKSRNAQKVTSDVGKVVKKYNPNYVTVTGRTLSTTAQNRAGAIGVYPCPHCGQSYEMEVSLQYHISRKHNEKARFPCPENCGKFLTSQGAIAKHLLSHRPREQWPFRCEFCGQQFQAKSDLPKHWQTSKHANDPRIPKPNTPAYRDVLQRSEIAPNLTKMKKEAKESILNSSLVLSPPSSSRSSAESMANSPNSDPLSQVLSKSDATFVNSALKPLAPSMFSIDDSNEEAKGNNSNANAQNDTIEDTDDIPDLDL